MQMLSMVSKCPAYVIAFQPNERKGFSEKRLDIDGLDPYEITKHGVSEANNLLSDATFSYIKNKIIWT